MTPPTSPTPEAMVAHASAELDRALGEARALLSRITELHAALASQPDPLGPAEQELSTLFARRGDLTRRIGTAALRLVACGATISASPPRTPGPLPGLTSAPISAPDLPAYTPEPAQHRIPPPEARGEQADPASLLALAQGGLTPQWSQEQTNDARRQALTELCTEAGRPKPLSTRRDTSDAITHLTAAIARMDAWLDQPQEIQKALMGLISSLARQIQDESEYGLTYAEDEALRSAFSRMTAWSREHRPGFVPGLSRSNPPDRGSWLEDGLFWWAELSQDLQPKPLVSAERLLHSIEASLQGDLEDPSALIEQVRSAVDAGLPQRDPRLIALLAPHQELFQGAQGMKTLKAALREARREPSEDPDEDEGPDDPVPNDWPLLELTEDRHAVLLGGDPRPQAAERIGAAFRLGQVEWEPTDVRRVTALAERIRKGNVDLVVMFRRFLSHREQDLIRPACQETGVPICVVDTGYGVTQVKLAMERYWEKLLTTSEEP
ncbi:MAG TPA: hypothetical protein ENK18_10915 [Deltaproteobacteria bacterium]|nr:hypothetical protein [Deltaproteobacteria bacterium]